MSIGTQLTVSQLNQFASQYAVAFRESVDGVNYFNDFLQNLGPAGLTAAPFNMSSGDATNLLEIFSNLASVTVVLEGGDYTGPSLPHNFIDDTIPLWAGQ